MGLTPTILKTILHLAYALRFKGTGIGFTDIGMMVNARASWGSFSPFVGVGAGYAIATGLPDSLQSDDATKAILGVKSQVGLGFRVSSNREFLDWNRRKLSTNLKKGDYPASMSIYIPFLNFTVYRDPSEWR
jgi:hypothetical protein